MNSEGKSRVVTAATHDWYPLWIDDEWYIRVDAEGRCIGKCGEGALGFIVQLSSNRDDKAVRALKIPRLVAETERENAYISELLSHELAAVRDVFDQPGAKLGLVGARDTSGPFQRPLRIERLEDAMEWNGALLFVRFEKGQNPYFCLVNKDNGQAYPPQAVVPCITPALYEQIYKASRTVPITPEMRATGWSQMVFVVQVSAKAEGSSTEQMATASVQQANLYAIFNAGTALSAEETMAHYNWYTCIPSVTYDWAPNTLQEAIGRGDRGGTWSIDDHLELIEQVCKGIKVLHNKGMLHADIRPANIVYLGEPIDPANYVLSDYGSFAYSNAQPLQADDQRPSDGTITGPVVEGERVSPFYAPERGASREREIADMALVVFPGGGPFCYVLVGWQSEFIELGLLDEVANPKLTATQYQDFITKRRNQFGGERSFEHSLREGDRVQLRDYIFQLLKEEEILGNMLIFECAQKFWTVYHGRIAIYENKTRQACFAFPIPRIVELPQWSAATDIFSLGVLCLYSLYAELLTQQSALVSQELPPTPSQTHADVTDTETAVDDQEGSFASVSAFGHHIAEPMPATQTHSKNSSVKLDEDFEVMLKYLADKSLFNAVWPQLEWLRKQIEDKLDEEERQHWTADRLANHRYEPKAELESAGAPEISGATGTQTEQRTLQSETIKVISQITSTVPGIEHLLRPLSEKRNGSVPEYQLGPFIFFLHFVLCCLHRQDSMDREKRQWVQDGWMTVPFCQDRHDRPDNGAADKALDRLMKIRSIIKAGGLKGLTAAKNKIAQFDLRPESAIRADLRQLREKEQAWSNERYELEKKIKKLEEGQKEKERHQQLVKELEHSFNDAIKLVEATSVVRFSLNRAALLDEMSTLFTKIRQTTFTDRDEL